MTSFIKHRDDSSFFIDYELMEKTFSQIRTKELGETEEDTNLSFNRRNGPFASATYDASIFKIFENNIPRDVERIMAGYLYDMDMAHDVLFKLMCEHANYDELWDDFRFAQIFINSYFPLGINKERLHLHFSSAVENMQNNWRVTGKAVEERGYTVKPYILPSLDPSFKMPNFDLKTSLETPRVDTIEKYNESLVDRTFCLAADLLRLEDLSLKNRRENLECIKNSERLTHYPCLFYCTSREVVLTALSYHHPDTLTLIQHCGNNMTFNSEILYSAITCGNVNIVNWLFSRGLRPDTTALNIAAYMRLGVLTDKEAKERDLVVRSCLAWGAIPDTITLYYLCQQSLDLISKDIQDRICQVSNFKISKFFIDKLYSDKTNNEYFLNALKSWIYDTIDFNENFNEIIEYYLSKYVLNASYTDILFNKSYQEKTKIMIEIINRFKDVSSTFLEKILFQSNGTALIAKLIKNGLIPNPSWLKMAIEKNNVTLVRYLLGKKVKPNDACRKAAATLQNGEISKLVEEGLPVNHSTASTPQKIFGYLSQHATKLFSFLSSDPESKENKEIFKALLQTKLTPEVKDYVKKKYQEGFLKDLVSEAKKGSGERVLEMLNEFKKSILEKMPRGTSLMHPERMSQVYLQIALPKHIIVKAFKQCEDENEALNVLFLLGNRYNVEYHNSDNQIASLEYALSHNWMKVADEIMKLLTKKQNEL